MTTTKKRRKGVSAERLRSLAENMDKRIADKLDPAIGRQNHTARRARIASSMRREGYRLLDVKRARNKMADAIDGGTLPDFLVGVYSERDLLDILFEPDPHDDSDWANRCRARYTQERDWLKSNDDEAEKEARKEKERLMTLRTEIASSRIPGFFPTPDWLADRMADCLNVHEGDEVLEPSAGMGSLADAVKRKHGDHTNLTLVETNHTLCEYLRGVGYEPHFADILDARGEVDHVIMNPPYETGQDMDHTRHCFELLRPGGRIVTLISPAFRYRKDKRARAFREWIESNRTILMHEETIENAFKGKDSLKQTGVTVVLLVIDKPMFN